MTQTLRKPPLNVGIDPDLMARLEKWIASQVPRPSKTAVTVAALTEFLDRREPVKARRAG